MVVKANEEDNDENRKHNLNVIWLQVEEPCGYSTMEVAADDFRARNGVQQRLILQNALWKDSVIEDMV